MSMNQDIIAKLRKERRQLQSQRARCHRTIQKAQNEIIGINNRMRLVQCQLRIHEQREKG